ncbi:YecA family protein [Candidatus Methylospira mobilis]|uniref:YecA family protein n=1 Tax=Candidatus Methylospira mobilis TaxID=1808979 RepID=A0A5Q0BFI6_9GAMM|nr:UPF0149 family protein [Candidatus Methylospira mobilis]QFY42635.1 YecA family protein [Candidatus Methylospira mobilis]WNV04249.1 UPF0149 family protein [Candidatus Methylospira mobilis]
MNNQSEFTDADLAELEDFFSSEALPESCMYFSMLDGFLAAVKLLPFELELEKCLPWIWDVDSGNARPPFDNEEEQARITALIERYADSIRAQIDEQDYAPMLDVILHSDLSEYYDAGGWCDGFLIGTQLAPDLWDTVFAEEAEALAPLLLLGTEEGEQILSESENAREAALAACEELPDMVEWLAAYFQRPPAEDGSIHRP